MRANAKAEDAIGWKNYGSYHQKFGDIAQLLGDGQLIAVENGRAGIWPERVRRMVQSGDFASIDVVNSHHYTGTDAPELNVEQPQHGLCGDENVMSFFDQLRAAKKAATSDGKPRQHWLTEFGWDTKAGPVVSPDEQAAYLAARLYDAGSGGNGKGLLVFRSGCAQSQPVLRWLRPVHSRQVAQAILCRFCRTDADSAEAAIHRNDQRRRKYLGLPVPQRRQAGGCAVDTGRQKRPKGQL